ncbi:DUF2933 domain-containing protein [Candidatus Woesearchaeota archaeon]|nr:DUF2933 domain-containing protein [Candidatus Woesearchaeota archaeon]
MQHKSSHKWLMLACVGIPIALIIIAVVFGIRSPWVYWIALAACPITHLIMMKLHKGESCH